MKYLKYLILFLALLIPIISNSGSVIIIDPSNEESSSTTTTIETFSESEGSLNNCGVYISGTTLTIKGSDGDSLSASAPCRVGISSDSTGQNTTATFSSNVSLTFGSASNLSGNLFGISEANWADQMPMFLGVAYDGTAPIWTISRVPIRKTGSLATDMCQIGGTDCDAQDDVMLITSGLTLADFVDTPVTQVGWVAATYATSGTVWTLSMPQLGGFNTAYESVAFSFPMGQMGSSPGTFFLPNGGTSFAFSTNTYTYSITRSGIVTLIYDLSGDGGTDGAGAVVTQQAMPFVFRSGVVNLIQTYNGYTEAATTITSGHVYGGNFTEGTSYLVGRYLNAAAVPAATMNNMFTNGNRVVRGCFVFTIFGN